MDTKAFAVEAGHAHYLMMSEKTLIKRAPMPKPVRVQIQMMAMKKEAMPTPSTIPSMMERRRQSEP
jgi:hypothetical protein